MAPKGLGGGREGATVLCGKGGKKKRKHKSVRDLTWIYSTLAGKQSAQQLCAALMLRLKPPYLTRSDSLTLHDWLCLCMDLLAWRGFCYAFLPDVCLALILSCQPTPFARMNYGNEGFCKPWICSSFTFCYVVVQYCVLCCYSAVLMDQLGLGTKTSWLGKIMLWLQILATNIAENG